MTGQLALDTSARLHSSGAAKPLLAEAVLTSDVASILSLQNLAYLSYLPSSFDPRAVLASQMNLNPLTPVARMLPPRVATLALNTIPLYSLA